MGKTPSKSPLLQPHEYNEQSVYGSAREVQIRQRNLSSAEESISQGSKEGRNMTLGELLTKNTHNRSKSRSSVGRQHDSISAGANA